MWLTGALAVPAIGCCSGGTLAGTGEDLGLDGLVFPVEGVEDGTGLFSSFVRVVLSPVLLGL